MTGQRSTTDSWAFQMLDENIPSLTALADCFNDFLKGLTAHFVPLDLTDCELDLEVPREFLVNQRVVYKALRQIKPNKFPGPSPIPNKILMEFAAELCPVLTDMYYSSLKQGYVPAQLKESLVRPLPKGAPPKSVDSDLTPIILTAQIAKIMEGFTLSSLYSQVIDNIDFLQFALPGKSTTHALIYILHCTLEALDTGKYCVGHSQVSVATLSLVIVMSRRPKKLNCFQLEAWLFLLFHVFFRFGIDSLSLIIG